MKSMKIYLSLFTVVFLCQLVYCGTTGTNKKKPVNYNDSIILELDKMDMEFNMEFYHKHKDAYGRILLDLTKDNGTLIQVFGDDKFGFAIKERKKNSFFILVKEFDGNGEVKEKGIRFGNCKIGKWVECTEDGDCQTIDYEENRGKFGCEAVLKFLDKKNI